MLKPINSNYQIFRLIGSGIFFGLLIFSLSVEVFAGAQLNSNGSSLNALFSSWNKAVINYEETKYQPNSKLPTDLFGTNKRNYSIKRRATFLKGMQDTQSFLEKQYPSCRITTREVASMLFFIDPGFAKEIRNQLESSKLPQHQEYLKICAKLTSCIEGHHDKNLNKSCDLLIKEPYLMGVQAQQHQLNVEEANLGNDRYLNGKKEDSAFDLLVDIGKIGSIFFQESKTNPELLFYRLPTFKANTSTPQPGNQGNPLSGTGGKTTPSNHTHATGGINLSSSYLPESSTRPNTNANTTLTEDKEIEHFIQAHEPLQTLNAEGELAFVNYCIVGSDLTEHLNDLAQETPQNNALELPEAEIDNYISSILQQSNTLKELSQVPSLPSSPSSPSSLTLSTQKSAIDEAKKQLESCVKKCEGLALDESAICKLQCLCAEYRSPSLLKNAKFQFIEEGALRLRICTIPSKITLVTTKTKTFYSIEELLKEIKKVVDGLYEGGELTTKTRVKEFLDTAQAKYQFHKNFSFMLGLGTKNATTSVNDKQLQKAETRFREEIKTNKSHLNDRNRYLILDNYETLKSQKSTRATEDSIPKTVTPPGASSTLFLQDQFSTQNDLISDFLDQNITLLYQMKEAFQEMDSAVKSLFQKK